MSETFNAQTLAGSDAKLSRRIALKILGAGIASTILPATLWPETVRANQEKKYTLPNIDLPSIYKNSETAELLQNLNTWYTQELQKIDVYLAQVQYTPGLSADEQKMQEQNAKKDLEQVIFTKVYQAYICSMYLHIHSVLGFYATGGAILNVDTKPLVLNPSVVHQIASLMFAQIGIESYFVPNPKLITGAVGLGQFTKHNGVIQKDAINVMALDEQIKIMFAVMLSKIYGIKSLYNLANQLESTQEVAPNQTSDFLRLLAANYNGGFGKQQYANRAMEIYSNINVATNSLVLQATQDAYQNGGSAPNLDSQIMDNLASSFVQKAKQNQGFVDLFVKNATNGLATDSLKSWLRQNLGAQNALWSNSREVLITKPNFKVKFG